MVKLRQPPSTVLSPESEFVYMKNRKYSKIPPNIKVVKFGFIKIVMVLIPAVFGGMMVAKKGSSLLKDFYGTKPKEDSEL